MDDSRREGEGGRGGKGEGGEEEHGGLINIPAHHFTSCFLVLNLYFSCHLLLSIISSIIVH